MERIDTLIVDKTGTLTEGKPAVTAIVTMSGLNEDQVLHLAGSVEQASEHPLAIAIVAAAKARALALPPVTHFDSPTGKGVLGTVENQQVMLGGANFFRDQGIETAPLQDRAEDLRKDGATALFMAVDQRLAAVIAIADPIKSSTPDALAALKQENIEIVMLTGDNRTTALAVARKLGITAVEAEVLPDEKSAVVERYQEARPARSNGGRWRE